MKASPWNEQDLRRMESLGISPSEADRQLDLFKNPPPPISLVRPAVVGDGILRLSQAEVEAAERNYEEARRLGRLLKFVPASGAATRMFLALRQLLDKGMVHSRQLEAPSAGPEGAWALKLMEALPAMAFAEDLDSALRKRGLDLGEMLQRGEYGAIWETLITESGLDYSKKPKGLIKFHSHPGESRTSLEEHLAEAIQYVQDHQGLCKVHFTVAAGQVPAFEEIVGKARKNLEEKKQVRLEVGYSHQNPALDTLAVDLENQPFRNSRGELVFRPAGHGALLENLNELKGDIVYIKNIDNVAVGKYLEITVDWKKRLAGFLAGFQSELFGHMRVLKSPDATEGDLGAARLFAEQRLGFIPGREEGKPDRESLIEFLNRPIRVCGMVPNQGEPGGGPFWVRGADGRVALQIVESAQVDPLQPQQQALFKSGSHFNPVDLVCGLRDWEGKPFDLKRFADPSAVFISRKSMEGRELKALELPGLWNGSMAGWITLFVEVPLETFNPVKTVFDLLKPAHQT